MNRRRTCSMTILNSLFLRNIPGGVPRGPILFILKWVSLIDVFSYRFNQGIKDGTSGNTPFHSKGWHFGERPQKRLRKNLFLVRYNYEVKLNFKI